MMSELNIDDFREILLDNPLDSIVSRYLFSGVPYAFREEPDSENLLKQHLSQELNVEQEDVIVVGSGRVGFSLNPDNFPRGFSETSDIDVVVISDGLFDEIWMTLLSWHYPRRGMSLGRVEGDWARLRRKDIYWGWLVPSDIRYEGLSFPDILNPLRDISTKWFNAFQSLSLIPQFASRTVSGRLYRTKKHAVQYHVEGLRLIREKIKASKEGG